MDNNYLYKSDTIEDLNNILSFINRIDQNNFYFIVQYKKFDEKHIKILTMDLLAKMGVLQSNINILDMESDDWIFAFCTDNKGKYAEADKLIKTIGGSIATMVDIAKKWQLKSKSSKMLPGNYENPNGWNASFLSSDNTQLPVFNPEEIFPTYVIALFQTILSFSSIVKKGIENCKRVLEREMEIKNNSTEAKKLFDYFKAKVILMVKDISYKIESSDINPMIGMWENMKGDDSFYSKAYHNFSMKNGKNFICYLILEEGKQKGLENDAISVFGVNPKIVSENNYVIANFDTIVGKMRNGKPINKLPTKYIAYFLSVSQYTGDYKNAIRYFYDHYKNEIYQLPKQRSVYAARTNLDKNSSEYKQFLIYRDELLSRRQEDLTIGNNASKNLEYSRP